MDLMMIDVSKIDGVQAGDEVVLMGRDGNEEVSCAELAEPRRDNYVGNHYPDWQPGAAGLCIKGDTRFNSSLLFFNFVNHFNASRFPSSKSSSMN